MTDQHPPSPASNAPESMTAALGGIFAALLGAEAEEGASAVAPVLAAPGAKRAVEALECHNPGHFHLFWAYPFEKLTRGMLQAHGIPPFGDQAQIFLEYSFYERHFSNIYSTFEGGACSVDKGRWAMSALLTHFKTGNPIEVVRTERAFWLPRRVLNTHESVLGFFKALSGLLYGNPKPYLEALQQLAQTPEA